MRIKLFKNKYDKIGTIFSRKMYCCPKCNFGEILDDYNFCPDCGSKIKWFKE